MFNLPAGRQVFNVQMLCVRGGAPYPPKGEKRRRSRRSYVSFKYLVVCYPSPAFFTESLRELPAARRYDTESLPELRGRRRYRTESLPGFLRRHRYYTGGFPEFEATNPFFQQYIIYILRLIAFFHESFPELPAPRHDDHESLPELPGRRHDHHETLPGFQGSCRYYNESLPEVQGGDLYCFIDKWVNYWSNN
jgi:hypothetical protein